MEQWQRKEGDGKRNQQLTSEQEDALDWYVLGNGMWINQYYRGIEDGFFNDMSDRTDFGNITDEEKRLMRLIDEATNNKLPSQILYRSVDAESIFGKMSDLDYENLVNKIVYKANDKYSNQAYEKLMKRVKNSYTEKGHMSTTKNYEIARDWYGFTGSNKPIVLRIQTTNKTKGIDLDKHNVNRGQQEVLLRRNQTYKVKGISAKDGNIFVDVTI